MNVLEVLTHKFHGVPGWVILLAAGGATFLYIRHRSATGAATTASDTSATDTGATDTGYGGGGYDSGGGYYDGGGAYGGYGGSYGGTTGGSPPSSNGGGTTTNPPPTTNQHTVSHTDIVSQILKDYAKLGGAYFTAHPNALSELQQWAPKQYAIVQAKLHGTTPIGTMRPATGSTRPTVGGARR